MTRRVRHVTGAKSAGAAPIEGKGPGLNYDDPSPDPVGKTQDTFGWPISAVPACEIPTECDTEKPYSIREDLIRDLVFVCSRRAYPRDESDAGSGVAGLSFDDRNAIAACLRRLRALDRLIETHRAGGYEEWPIFLSGDSHRAKHLVPLIVGRNQTPTKFEEWTFTLKLIATRRRGRRAEDRKY